MACRLLRLDMPVEVQIEYKIASRKHMMLHEHIVQGGVCASLALPTPISGDPATVEYAQCGRKISRRQAYAWLYSILG